ncbi:MAG: DUF4249 family protein [Ignavibacteriales bacterium]|nr:DUF4249 family protein [Ignavibacteriales bacterium]
MKAIFLIAATVCPVVFILIAGCNQPFDPKGEFHEQLVVYSILTNNRPVQIVRVYSTYDPPGFDPLAHHSERLLTGATVTLREDATTYFLADTLIPRPDTSRFSTSMVAYSTTQLRPQFGKAYFLSVETAQLGTSTSSITLPARASMSFIGGLLLDAPDEYRGNAEIQFVGYPGKGTRAAVFRLYVDYTVQKGTAMVDERVEVPYDFRDTTSNIAQALYPGMESFTIGSVRKTYLAALIDVFLRYPGARLKFNQVVFFLLQGEEQFYKYHSIVNGFRDAFSIRTDQPSYSNINGGLGVFAGYSVDSLVHKLPEDFYFNRNP